MDREISISTFNPRGKEYYYTACNEDFCYKNKYGVCSLDLSDEEAEKIDIKLSSDEFYKYRSKTNVQYCRDIYKSLLNNGQRYLVYLNQGTCRHYTFTDGQHRVCIAAKMGLKLNVKLYIDSEYTCRICNQEKKIKNAICNVEDMVRKTMPRRTIFHKILRIYPRSAFQDSLEKWKRDLDEFQLIKAMEYKKF